MKNYDKLDVYNEETLDKLSENYKNILSLLGEDVDREGLEKTPRRVAKAMSYITNGYQIDPVEILKSALFNEDHQEMVIVKDIELYSMCEHHMLPFFGRAHIGYLPNGKITGLSKMARVVDAFSRRLQVQERMTTQIMNAIKEALEPHGVAVVIEARHLCMMMRGVEKQNSATTTSAFSGVFMENNATRKEFLNLIANKYS
jgi:GTP cyclohydrolase I